MYRKANDKFLNLLISIEKKEKICSQTRQKKRKSPKNVIVENKR